MACQKTYWAVTFTLKTWAEAQAAGGNVVGFRARSRGSLWKIAVGDFLLCYLIGVSRFIAVQEVESEVFVDNSPIWEDDEFPFRVMTRDVVRLDPETAVPVISLSSGLSIFQNLKNRSAWAVHFQTSPRRWKEADGRIVVAAVKDAKKNPVQRSLQHRERLVNVGPVADHGQ